MSLSKPGEVFAYAGISALIGAILAYTMNKESQ